MASTSIENLSSNTISLPIDIGGGSLASGVTTIVAFDYTTVANSLINAGLIGKVALHTIHEAPAGVVDFTTVAAALGGEAGAHTNFTFKSDGLGSGTMTPNIQVIPNVITVGLGGDVDFITIKGAVDAAIADGVSGSNPFVVKVHPGIYNEDPMTIIDGLTVTSVGNEDGAVIVNANNPDFDLFTMTGGFLIGLTISGVTDPVYALIRCSSTAGIPTVNSCALGHCSNGIWAENGATIVCNDITIAITSGGNDIDTAFVVDGLNTNAVISRVTILVPAAVIPFYSINPIRRCVAISNQAQAQFIGFDSNVAFFDSTQVVFYADTGSRLLVQSSIVINSNTALQIAAGGSNTTVIAQGVYLSGNVLNVQIDSSTGLAFAAPIFTDHQAVSVVPGGLLSGINQQLNMRETFVILPAAIRFPNTSRSASVGNWILDDRFSGIDTGGVVTDGGGLNVNITAGTGWVNRDTDVADVSWDAATLTLPDNSTSFVFIDDGTLLPTSSLSVPESHKITLAIVVTKSAAIRYIHTDKILVGEIEKQIQDYLLATRKFLLKTGLGLTQGSTNVRIDIAAGSYYRGLELVPYVGSTDTTFSYFYGTDGATEVSGQQNLDNTRYDNAGTLTTMTDGYYRADTVYLTSDGRVSIIYGTSEVSNLGDAQALGIGIPPSFIIQSAFSVANVIIQKNAGIAFIKDERVVSTTGNGSLVVTDHSQLTGLLNDDHPQYLLASGLRPMAGELDMGTNDIIDVGLVDGVTVSAHAIRHQPGGIDAIATAVPVNVLGNVSPSEGSATSLSRSDHQHGIAVGNAVSVGLTNAPGTSSSLSRADHLHSLPTVGTAGSYSYVTFDAYGRETSGVLNSIFTTSRLTGGGDLSVSRTLDLATVGTAGTYSFGNGSITFDAYGRETAATSASNLVLTTRNVNTTAGQLTGGGALSSDLTLGLATSGVSANTYTISTVTVDTFGRVTSASSGTTGTPVATGNANSAGSGTALTLANHVHQTKADVTSVSATSTVTTTSTTDVAPGAADGTGLSLTPGAGNWLATFSCQFQNAGANQSVIFSIYVNGSQVAVTERGFRISSNGQNYNMSVTSLLTGVGAGQVVDVRWRVGGNTGQITNRELVLVRAV